MKVIVQRASLAKVMVGDELISCIGPGLCCLVGITTSDTEKDADYIARKILALRLFEDKAGKRWQRCVKDEQLEILCVSQFTLYHRLKGNKPDFHLAMGGDAAQSLYNYFLKKLSQEYVSEKIKGFIKFFYHAGELYDPTKEKSKAATKDTSDDSEDDNGKFGAYMQVHIVNDGPVTLELESPSSVNTTQEEKPKDI